MEYTAGRDSGAYQSASKRAKHDESHVAQTEEDQKLERDVTLQRQKAAARARREQQQQQQQHEDEEASGEERAQYEDDGEDEEQ